MLRQIECIISGRVHGVLYRDFARRKARGLGLVGMVENLPDGTVHVVAQGDESELNRFIADLERGSIFSRVDKVIVKWSNAEQAFSDFTIRYNNLSDRF
ncbi:MAG: acylphosphatase [Candidatus Taylorbacteria bacterium]|nr:acylphosphatase [Candidatus Taylorbacteria bacterium]